MISSQRIFEASVFYKSNICRVSSHLLNIVRTTPPNYPTTLF